MAELKRVFSDAKMNKDMDERLVPNGQYRDANNIEIATSEGSNVGTVQTILANTARNTLDQGGVTTSLFNSGTSNVMGPHNKSTCVASVAAPDRDRIYYFVSAGDYYSTNGLQSLRKDYIIEYNTVSEKSKYVFVDIFRSDTTVSADPGTTTFHVALGSDDSINKTGIRVGMTIGSSDIEVSSIVYDTSGETPINKWKITTNKAHTLSAGGSVSFTAPRVLKFSKRNIITGINILDDFIFWTDNESEPKKINIRRSIAGTGGTALLNANPSDAFIGDYDYFHTRIAKNKSITADAENIYKIDGGEPVEEANVTVIRKGPTQPLELEMFRTSSERVDDEGNETAITATQSAFAYATNNTLFTTDTEPFSVEFTDTVHFKENDIVLISSAENSLSPNSSTDYSIRAEVVSSNVNNPNLLYSDGFTIKILSIDGSLGTNPQTWYFKLEDTRPVFENMFPRFSYRYKYQDGEYSTFAPWSAVGFLPDKYEYLPKKGYNLGMVNQLRSLKLKGYFAKDGIRPKDLAEIDLLYKEAGKPAIYTVKTIKESDGGFEWPNQVAFPKERGEFTIETDIIHAVVPSNQILRPWDNVPRKALAQEISANRLIYGNYLQNYTVLEDPIVNISVQQDKLSLLDYNLSAPSVKTMRKYQVGVVFSDSYGRETPVLTTKKSSVTVLKDASDTRNRLVCSLDKTTPNIPEWAKYLSYYIKETSVEYYSMAMDRWYMASDGNVWISFPSSERNKLDNETFIVLKKAHGSNIAIKDKARYKILAIKSEAPDHIKTERKSLGKVLDNGSSIVGEGGEGWPLVDTTFIHVATDSFEAAFGDQLHILTPDSMYLRVYGDGSVSNTYEISRLIKTGEGSDGGYYKIQLAGKFNDDVSFTTANGTYATAIGDLSVEIIEHEVENRPEFDGRFFVKIHSDAALRKHVLVGQEDNIFVSSRWKLGYLNNNGYTNPDPHSGEAKWDASMFDGYDYMRNVSAHEGTDYQDNAPGYSYVDEERHVSMTGLHPTEWLHHTQGTASGGLNQNKYWWGDINYSTEGGEDSHRAQWGVSQEMIDQNPVYALNDAGIQGASELFWAGVRGRYGFFIDAATAFSYTGKLSGGGLAKDTGEFWDEGYGLSNAHAEKDWAGFENEKIANTKTGKGQPSRGIWSSLDPNSDISYMDIAWSGLGNNNNVTGFSNGQQSPGFTWLRLNDIPDGWGGDSESDSTQYYRAGRFIEQLVQPGTKFRFARDPDRHVYQVMEDMFPTYQSGGGVSYDGYNDTTTFESGTNRYTGVWGIRNYRTYGNTHTYNKDRNQYAPDNIRQRWTLTVSPKIGERGPSYYSPTKGTGGYSNDNGVFTAHDLNAPNASSANFRRALRHDLAGPLDAIEILEVFADGINKGGFVSNPAVWETEPKESVELDIYYQASGLIPLELNNKTNEEYIPVGSTFYSVNTGDQSSTKHTVTSLDDQTVNFTPAWDGDGTDSGEIVRFAKRSNYYFEAVLAAQVGTGETSLRLSGGPGSSVSTRIAFQKQYLDWSNCWSFGNGVESDRVRDDFNTAQVDNGVKASTVLAEQTREERRKHGLIWSGIYNSNSGVNDTNQFIAAEKITKDLNPIYGSIQALLNRDTRLVMFCEDKVLRGVTNKDALYNADGNPQLVSSNTVIGDVTPYKGDYGISTNPESIAVTPSTTYFTDAVKGRVLALSTEGIRPISDIGMKGYFSDFMNANIFTCLGSYDDRKKEYNISMYKKYNAIQPLFHEQATVSYSEISKGWVSFKSFYPQSGLSLNGNYYTFSDGGLWQHYLGSAYSTIYGDAMYSDITVLFNDQPDTSKKFMTINYEGSKQDIPAFTTESHATTYTGNSDVNEGISSADFTDSEYYNLDAQLGWSAESLTTNLQSCGRLYFKDKEGKYFSYPTGEATVLSNLDEKEFTVQGIGLANITHNDSGVGNVVTITLANNTSSTYEGISGTGTAWDADTAVTETSRWSVDTAEVVTNAGATIESGVSRVLTITPIVNGVYSGFPLSASNLEWGGASNSSGNVWDHDDEVNADPDFSQNTISSITFTDLGQPGTASNTVTATLQFSAGDRWPNASATWRVDIDDKATAPESETRKFYLKTKYDNLPATQQIAPPTIATFYTYSNLDTGTSSGIISNGYSGEVLNDETTLITSITFSRVGSFYYLGGNAFPSVTFENLGEYEGSYTSEITNVLYSQPNHVTNFKVKIYYTPPQGGLAIVDEATMADLGHTAIINYVMKPPNTAVTYDITNVAHPSNVAYGAASVPVVIHGKYNASYRIFVQKKTSTTSGVTSSTGGYYNFDTDLFQTAPVHGTGTISTSGLTAHIVALPQVILDARYDITIEALNGPVLGTVTTLSPQVPTLPGDAIVIHKGIRTLSIKPHVVDIADFEAIGVTHTVLVSKPAISANTSSRSKSSETIFATTGSEVSGKTKLTLSGGAKRVKSGMLVLAPFQVSPTLTIPLGVTVVSVRRNNIVLSTSCTIPAGTELSFVSGATDLIPFTINVVAAGTSSRTTLTLKPDIDYKSSIGGMQAQIQTQVSAATSSTTVISTDSNRGLKVGMRVTGAGVVPDPAYGYLRVTDVSKDTFYVSVSTEQTLADNTLLTFSWPEDDPTLDVYDEYGGPNTGVVPRHIMASIIGTDTLKIEGYIQVSSITKKDTMDIYINDFVTVS